MNRQYLREHAELDLGLEAFEPGPRGRPISVLIVEDLDRKTMHALQYANTIHSSITHAVHLEGGPADDERLSARWAALGIDVPLRFLPSEGDLRGDRDLCRGTPRRTGTSTVIVPGPARMGRLERLRRGRYRGAPRPRTPH